MFINIHSHQLPVQNEFVIQNLYSNFELTNNAGYYSIGLHPWYITEATIETALPALEQFAGNKNILAIGECGLDKICTTGFVLQQKAFSAQIDLANQLKKPLIIHCVRAYDEVQQLLQQQHNKVPVIFHGYNKSSLLAHQLISKGFYLSFGKALQQKALQQLIINLPPDKFFLETDDAQLSIEEVCALASATLQIDINSLSLQIQKNAAAVFGAGLF